MKCTKKKSQPVNNPLHTKKSSYQRRQNRTTLAARIIAAILLVCILLGLVVVIQIEPQTNASSVDTEESLLQSLREIRAEKERLDNELAAAEEEQLTASEELRILTDQLLVFDQEYAYQERLAAEYKERVETLRNELIQVEEEENTLYAEVSSLLRTVEESPRISFWSVLFKSSDMREALNAISAVNEIVSYEKKQLAVLGEKREELADTRYELQVQENNYSLALRDMVKQKAEMEARNEYLNTRLQELSETQKNIKAELEYLAPRVTLSASQTRLTQPLDEDQITALLAKASEELEQAGLSEYEIDCRLRILQAGLGIVGKVPYFWGGRVYTPGWNEKWNTMQPIQHAGCDSYPLGEYFPYGLDCGGFVFWAAMTMYGVESWASPVSWMSGKGATGIFNGSTEVSWGQKLPGDVVVNTPLTHIGYYLCTNDNGQALYLHCCGGYGVVVSTSTLCKFDRAASLDF